MEGRYPAAVMITLSDCPQAGTEGELNRWYDEILVPGLEASPLIGNVLRYVNAYTDEPTFRSHPKYLTIAEVETDDPAAALPELRALYTGLRARRDAPEMFRLDTLYARTGPEFSSPRS